MTDCVRQCLPLIHVVQPFKLTNAIYFWTLPRGQVGIQAGERNQPTTIESPAAAAAAGRAAAAKIAADICKPISETYQVIANTEIVEAAAHEQKSSKQFLQQGNSKEEDEIWPCRRCKIESWLPWTTVGPSNAD